MKKHKIRNLFLLFVFLFSIGFTGAVIESNDTPVALVKKIVKEVSFKAKDSSEWVDAKVGIPLKDGEEIRTGYRSLALVLFTDGSGILRVRENSILHIYGTEENKKINKNTFIQKGKVGFEVSKQEDEEFKFTTPTVVASIRGTGGYFDVKDDSSTVLIVEKGNIGITALMGSKQSGTVSGGSTATINTSGNINIQNSTENELVELNKSKKTSTKKLKIQTDDGVIEIEYYSNDE